MGRNGDGLGLDAGICSIEARTKVRGKATCCQVFGGLLRATPHPRFLADGFMLLCGGSFLVVCGSIAMYRCKTSYIQPLLVFSCHGHTLRNGCLMPPVTPVYFPPTYFPFSSRMCFVKTIVVVCVPAPLPFTVFVFLRCRRAVRPFHFVSFRSVRFVSCLFVFSAQNDTVAARNKQSEFTTVDYTFEDSREYRSVSFRCFVPYLTHLLYAQFPYLNPLPLPLLCDVQCSAPVPHCT